MKEYDGFGGEIIVVENEDDIQFVREKLAGHSIVGIDFEWDEGAKDPPVSLVQIATPGVAVLFRVDVAQPVLHPVAREILLNEVRSALVYVYTWTASQKIMKIGVGMGSSDFKKVQESFGVGIPPDQTIDMLLEAQKRGLPKPGLKGMCEAIGYTIDKPGYLPSFYHWTGEQLTRGQKLYAAGDAWFPILVAAVWGVIKLSEEEILAMKELIIKIPPEECIKQQASIDS
ncbi:hypothetical protein FOL47_006024 [Perkinsus chesapeaki]|uniref:3'-5' exonuclease domain-containing protein n=1 Tax=Perkinsus chesapeaki TaxID=330153 RepID=A0A7J6LU84_PERCH|nr:hypothetical protein FOL47_006024 [Perkinsus chesapeaki]